MIYDCFIFNNELDLLEIRLNELSDKVDKFVLVEAKKTFTKIDKPLYFNENKAKFKKFLHKINHIIVEDFNEKINIPDWINNSNVFSKNKNIWKNEIIQRNSILKGLEKCKKDDIVLIGDIDEIPNLELIKQIKDKNIIYGFEQNLFYYYLNNISETKWIGTKAVFFKSLSTPQEIRMSNSFKKVKNGGWHFSFLGGASTIKEKIKSFSHQEYNTKEINNLKRIEFNINNGLDIFDRPIKFKTINSLKGLPKYIIKNKNKYKKYFKPKIKLNDNLLFLTNEIIRLRNEKSELEIKNQKLNNNLIQKNIELKTITDSKIYKLWPIYCKIKNLFIKK